MPVSTVSIPVGQWLVSAEGTRWWFDSGSFALDFATTATISGDPAATSSASGPGTDRLHSPDDLTTWLRERFPVTVGAARTRDLFDAVSLRDAIGRMAVGASLGAAARTRRHRCGQPLRRDARRAAVDHRRPPPGRRSVHTVPQALSTIARDAVDLFSPANAGRIRVCSGDDCGMVYLDTSRAASRRWCSMQRCGNRAKVRAHRARKRPVAADVAA